MDKIQVNVVKPELCKALLKILRRCRCAVTIDPKLCGDKDLFPWYAARADSLSDILLVLVEGGCINMAISYLPRLAKEPSSETGAGVKSHRKSVLG